MRITVKTGAGQSPAPDITDDLLSSQEAMIARGKAFLFASIDARQQTISMPLQSMINTGEVGSVTDNEYDKKYIGKVTGVSIDIDGSSDEPSIDLKVDIEVPQ